MAIPSEHDPAGTETARSSRDRARLVAVAILSVAAAIFALVNLERVKVDLILGSARMPLFVVVVVCLLIGAAIGWFLARRGAKSG